jgi:hypothetical protein
MTPSEVTEAEIKELLDRHAAWLRDRTMVSQVGESVEITTPYLDRHNDAIQLFVKRDDDGFLLTDDGYTISDLTLSGVRLESAKRQSMLQLAVNGFGVTLEGDRLLVRATAETFAVKKQSLLQAAMAVNDLFYLSEPSVASLFLEDVQTWLDETRIRYLGNVSFPGRSGYVHQFDFAIPRSESQPERLLRAISNPDKQSAEVLIFSWLETRQLRPDAQVYAFLNDRDRPVSAGVKNALQLYDIVPVSWTQRAVVREELAA